MRRRIGPQARRYNDWMGVEVIKNFHAEGQEEHGAELMRVQGGDGIQGGMRAGDSEECFGGVSAGLQGAGVHGQPISQ